MLITKEITADKIGAYLRHEIALNELVDWAENVIMDGEFSEQDADVLRQVVPRLGVADTRAFSLAWDDCEELLHLLGYAAHVEIVSA